MAFTGPDRLWGQGADGGRGRLAAARNRCHSEARRSVQSSDDVGSVGWVGAGGWLMVVGNGWKMLEGLGTSNMGLKRYDMTDSELLRIN